MNRDKLLLIRYWEWSTFLSDKDAATLLNNHVTLIDAFLASDEHKALGDGWISCPNCNGHGYNPEHSDHHPEDACDVCPIAVPCEYCLATGKITTNDLREKIHDSLRMKSTNTDGYLPF